MSCNCRVAQLAPLARAIALMAPPKGDVWITLAFTPTHMVMHLATDDQCTTATATAPKEIFSDFQADPDCRFMVNLSNLMSGFQLCGPVAAAASITAVRIAYPDADSRCVMEAGDPERMVRCAMLTRPVKERLLDLRFQTALCPNKVALRGDISKEIVSDLAVMQADHVHVNFTPTAVCFSGTGSNFGSLTIEVSRHADGVLHFESGDDSLQPKYLSAHAMHALGGGASMKDVCFDRVTVRVNAERQLSVSHHGRDLDLDVQVQFAVQPLSALLDL
jgi:hypothetical protein